jgi:hypothetical protein
LINDDTAQIVKCDCTTEDEVDENPSGLGEEQGVLNTTAAELDENMALPQVRPNIHDGIEFDILKW